MGYISELRKRVGTYPLIMVGAAMVVLDSKNRLLLLHRTDNGCWGLPGGAMELGESLENTARRETREEAGIEVTQVSLFGVFSGPDLYYKYPNGDEVYNVTIVYTARYHGDGTDIQLTEHDKYAFFEMFALPSNVSPPIKRILIELIDRA